MATIPPVAELTKVPLHKRFLADWHYPAAVASLFAIILVGFAMWVLASTNTDLRVDVNTTRSENICRSRVLSESIAALGEQQIVLDDLVTAAVSSDQENMQALLPVLKTARDNLHQAIDAQLKVVDQCAAAAGK